MIKVFKYIIKLNDNSQCGDVCMPLGAKVLKVTASEASGTITLWAQIDTDESEVEQRCFTFIATGQCLNWEVQYSMSYMDTVFEGMYVWHIYECIKTLLSHSE